MDANLEAHIEDIAACVQAIHKDHARLEETINGALDHLTTVETHRTETAQSCTEVPDRLAQIAETMTRQAYTFVGYFRPLRMTFGVVECPISQVLRCFLPGI